MASTYSPSLQIEFQGAGENGGTWGTIANTGYSLAEEGITGLASVTITGNTTLTITQGTESSGNLDQGRKRVLLLTGTPGAPFDLTLPEVVKSWVIWNNTDSTASVQTASTTTAYALGSNNIVDILSQGDGTVSQLAPVVSDDGSFPALVASGLTYPSADGTNGQVMQTDGSGNLSFTTPSGSGDVLESQLTWQTKTSAYTAVNLDRILADTSGGAFTVTLPASPSTGAEVRFADTGANWGTNNLTVDGNGVNVDGEATFIANVNKGYFSAIYNGTVWVVRFAGGIN